jgi:Tfp pilus assembly PilM family ATPase
MLFFDISDTSIEIIKLRRGLLFGDAVVAYSRIESDEVPVEKGEIQNPEEFSKLISDLLKKGKPKPLEDTECAFTLPDKRVYTQRFTVPKVRNDQTVHSLLEDEMKKIIPQPLDELSFEFIPLNEGEGEEGEVFMMAAPKSLVKSYIDLFRKVKIEPQFVVSESYAAFDFLKAIVSPGGLTLHLDIGIKYTNSVFMDKKGVVEAFSEPVETKELLKGVGELIKFADKRLGRKVDQIILGGGGSSRVDAQDMAGKLKVNVVSVEKAFEHIKLPIKTDFGKWSKVVFVNVLGLALLSKEKNPVSLPF